MTCLSIFLVPILKLQHAPLPPKCYKTRNMPQLLFFPLLSPLDSQLSPLRSLGVHQIKSTMFVIVDFTTITFNITPIVFMNIKYLKYQSFKVMQYDHKKMIQKIMLNLFMSWETTLNKQGMKIFNFTKMVIKKC